MRSTPRPPSFPRPPALLPTVPKQREQSHTGSAENTDPKIKWILAAAISAGIMIALFLIPLMLVGSNGGGKNDGKATGAPVKGAVALSIDSGKSKAADAPQSLQAQTEPATTAPVVESPNKSSENASAEDVPIELQSVPMLLTYQPKPSVMPKSSAESSAGIPSGTKSGSEIFASGGRNPFIGEGTSAKSTVFVVDVSGSMQNPERLPRVLASMTRAIELLSFNQKFAIILFDDQAYAFPNQLAFLPASNPNKQEAYAWLNDTKGGGGTNPIPGMDIAIRLAPERIVLLSDGEFDPRCIEFIHTANARNRQPAKIDCVGLDEEVETLKEIAKQNKGIYYQAY